MTQLVVEFLEDDDLAVETGRNADRSNGALMLAASEWRTLIWQPFADRKLRTEVFELRLAHPADDPEDKGETETVRFAVDDGLFCAIARLFLDYGEAGVTEARRIARGSGGLTSAARLLVDETIALLERLIAEQLDYIEAVVARHALKEQEDGLAKAEAAISQFKPVNYRETVYHQCLRAGLNDLYPLLMEARRLTVKVNALAARMDERNYKDGGGRETVRRKREHEPYRKRWFELFAGPQRELLAQLIVVQTRIGENWPDAILIVDRLDEDISDLLPVPRPSHVSRRDDELARLAELKYHSRIHAALVELAAGARQAISGLARPGIANLVKEFLAVRPDQRAKGLFERVTDVLLSELVTTGTLLVATGLPDPGVAADTELYDALLDLQIMQNQTRIALAIAPLLLRACENESDVASGTFRHAVLIHYRLHLLECLHQQRQDQADSAALWKRVQLVAAIGGLIFAAAGLPFGGEAALPASLELLSAATSLGLFVTGVVLTIHGVTSMIRAIDDAEHNVEKKLLELGQVDPDGLYEIGNLFSQNREIVHNGTRELVLMLAGLALGGSIRPLGKALELQGYYYDVETIYDTLGDGAGDGN